MAQGIPVKENHAGEFYAYMRKGEWGFGRYDCIGAELPNLAVKAWAEGRLSDDDLIDLIFASYRAKQEIVFQNPYINDEDEAAWAESRFRLEIYRVYKYLIGAEGEWVPADAMGQVIDLLAP